MGERVAAFLDNLSVKEACASNGLSEDDFVQRAVDVVHLEMFMGTSTDVLEAFRYFPELRSLCVMKQLGLEDVGYSLPTGLEVLWLTECPILRRLGGLSRCSSTLTTLHLSGNGLTDSVCWRALRPLTALKALWLCENKLMQVSCLESHTNLRELWLGGNEIDCLGTSLGGCVALEELSLVWKAQGIAALNVKKRSSV